MIWTRQRSAVRCCGHILFTDFPRQKAAHFFQGADLFGFGCGERSPLTDKQNQCVISSAARFLDEQAIALVLRDAPVRAAVRPERRADCESPAGRWPHCHARQAASQRHHPAEGEESPLMGSPGSPDDPPLEASTREGHPRSGEARTRLRADSKGRPSDVAWVRDGRKESSHGNRTGPASRSRV